MKSHGGVSSGKAVIRLGNAALQPGWRERSPHKRSWQQGGLPAGAAPFTAHCASCLNLEAEHGIGSHLDDLFGRRAGGVAGFSGTAALTSLDLFWTRENLADFIANPLQCAPGTTMLDTGITAEEAQRIADFLTSERQCEVERSETDFNGNWR